MQEIIVLSGQHVGKEIIPYATQLLQKIIDNYALAITLVPMDGSLINPTVLSRAKTAAAVLTGPLTGEEKNSMKEEFAITTELRPVICYAALVEHSPLRIENLEKGFDLLLAYSINENNEKTLSLGKLLAKERRNGIVSTLAVPVTEKDIRHLHAGQIATQFLFNQSQFDVIATTAESGETLTKLAQEIAGTPQLYATGWIGEHSPSVFEATALMQQIQAGKNTANPVCAFLAVANLLRHGLHLPAPADDIEEAIQAIFAVGARTMDLAPTDPFMASTQEMAEMIIQAL